MDCSNLSSDGASAAIFNSRGEQRVGVVCVGCRDCGLGKRERFQAGDFWRGGEAEVRLWEYIVGSQSGERCVRRRQRT